MAEDAAQSTEDDDFKYIVRLAGTDLDGEQQVRSALTSLKGLGNRTAIIVADAADLDRDRKLGTLADEEADRLRETVDNLDDHVPEWLLNRRNDVETGDDEHLVAGNIDMRKREDLNRLKKIRCYRGVRHEQGQKVRGQRTRSNGRTGLTVGVDREALQEQAQEGGDEDEEE
jgi:small subunit ribosomal protein S13